LCRSGMTVCLLTPPCAQMNPFFAQTLFICCISVLSVIFLGPSGLSFDGESRQIGRVKILETPDLCRSGGTVCLLTSPCAETNQLFARPLFICCNTLLFVIFLGPSGLSFDGEGRRKGRVEIMETPDLCRSGGTVCLLMSQCAHMNKFFARTLSICCMTLLSVFFRGPSGLSFDGEGRRKGRVKSMETPDLCCSGGTVCLLKPPCAQMNPLFARTLFICCMTLLSVIFLGPSGLSVDGEGRRKGRVKIITWPHKSWVR